jgi:hypothetical protein
MKHKKNGGWSDAEAARIEVIAKRLGYNLNTLTNAQAKEIAQRFDVDRVMTRAVELGLMEVIGYREDGEPVLRRTALKVDPSAIGSIRPERH